MLGQTNEKNGERFFIYYKMFFDYNDRSMVTEITPWLQQQLHGYKERSFHCYNDRFMVTTIHGCSDYSMITTIAPWLQRMLQ